MRQDAIDSDPRGCEAVARIRSQVRDRGPVSGRVPRGWQADARVVAPLLDGLRKGPMLAACGPEGVDGIAEWLDVDAVAPGQRRQVSRASACAARCGIGSIRYWSIRAHRSP